MLFFGFLNTLVGNCTQERRGACVAASPKRRAWCWGVSAPDLPLDPAGDVGGIHARQHLPRHRVDDVVAAARPGRLARRCRWGRVARSPRGGAPVGGLLVVGHFVLSPFPHICVQKCTPTLPYVQHLSMLLTVSGGLVLYLYEQETVYIHGSRGHDPNAHRGACGYGTVAHHCIRECFLYPHYGV